MVKNIGSKLSKGEYLNEDKSRLKTKVRALGKSSAYITLPKNWINRDVMVELSTKS